MKGFSIHIKNRVFSPEIFFDKQNDDSFVAVSPEFLFVLEGVILNNMSLVREYAAKNLQELCSNLYSKLGAAIINRFDGEFRGFIFDKIKNKVFVFINQTATQRVFYTKINSEIFIDSDLVRLNLTLTNKGYRCQPDITNIYQLLCFGNMLEDATPLEGVFKLPDGCFLEIDLTNSQFSIQEYFSTKNIEPFVGNKAQAINHLDEIFGDAVATEYQKNGELGDQSISFLSGGLDSRMALFYAVERGHTPDLALCFSQSNYWDAKISRKIAKDFNLNYSFIPLDGGSFLAKIDHLTRISGGTVHFTGAIHVQHALEHMPGNPPYIFHSGQIGDGVLGGFNTAKTYRKPSLEKITVNPEFLHKINDPSQIINNYPTEESFYLRNIAFNRTVLGALVLGQDGYQLSPFMTKDFMAFAVSLRPEYKYNQSFYIDWLNEKCPQAAKYTWERTLLRPTAPWKTMVGDKIVKPLHKYGNLLLNKPLANSMYPYEIYFKDSPHLQQIYKNYFDENLYRLDAWPELKQDAEMLFTKNSFYHKSLAINILAILKLYFP